jgi:hypothetical protein
MLDVARKKGPARRFEELPAWMHQLKGYNTIAVQDDGDNQSLGPEGVTVDTEFKSGTWRIAIAGAVDPRESAATVDPILMLAILANAAEEVDAKVTELARFCRTEGKTWTQIGEALGMSKQAAWERFSGED